MWSHVLLALFAEPVLSDFGDVILCEICFVNEYQHI